MQTFPTVSLVSTYHGAKGAANAGQLVAILESIKPEVIFVELPPQALDDFVKHATRINVEAAAVRDFMMRNLVDVVGVDTPEPTEQFFSDNELLLFTRVEAESHEFRRLVDLNSQSIALHGYKYLCSDQCGDFWDSFYEEYRRSVERIGDSQLVRLLDLWINTNQRRDETMLNNIASYCSNNSFSRGALLAGASHRRSLVEKAGAYSEVAKIVGWQFPE